MDTDILITRKQDEPGATTLAVEAPVELVRSAEQRAAKDYAKRARIPGFRKGKAPADVIRRRFGGAIREAVIRELITDSWKLALDRENLEPLAEPQVQGLKFEEGEPVTFEFLVETKPEIAIGRLGGFSIERKVAPVTDEMVESQLEEIRRQKAAWLPVEREKPKPDDFVRVTIATTTDEGTGEGKPYELVIGGGHAMPAVEEKIMELNVGETVETAITFPEDFADESKRGQSISTTITLHEVKRQDLPEPTDEFAREVGDFETIDALRQTIRDDLNRSAARDADGEVRRTLMEQLTAANNVPAPRPMVDRLLRAFAEAYEVTEDRWETFVAEFGPVAETQVKRDLLLDRVTKEHALEATEDDIDDRIAEIAKRRNTEPGKVYAAFQKENRLGDLERTLTEEKVFEFLLSQSTITDI